MKEGKMGKGEKGKNDIVRDDDAKTLSGSFPFFPFPLFPSYTQATT
jgi:hypothetical protein